MEKSDYTHLLRVGGATIITVFVLFIFVAAISGPRLWEMELISFIEIFVAIPILSVTYYWLISNKVGEFEKRLEIQEKLFEKIVKEFGIEEEKLTIEENDISTEEKTLKDDIGELKSLVTHMHSDLAVIQQQVKKKSK
ncbi:hypothetical protein ACFLQI_01420 [Candidatus Undinarchaeota archaeon]